MASTFSSSADREELDMDTKEFMREQIAAAATANLPSTQPASSCITSMNISKPHSNITEQDQPRDNNDTASDFVDNLLGHMNELSFSRPRLPQACSQTSQQQPNMEFFQITPNRKYRIGNDKSGHPNSRLWIDTFNNIACVFLYKYSEADSSANKDVFICIGCSRHNRKTTFEIRSLPNHKLELWEQRSHYQSCYLLKAEVVKIQVNYDRKRPNVTGRRAPQPLNIDVAMEEVDPPIPTPAVRVQPSRRCRSVAEEKVVLPSPTDKRGCPSIHEESLSSQNQSSSQQHPVIIATAPEPPKNFPVQNGLGGLKTAVEPFTDFVPSLLAPHTTILYNVPSSHELKLASETLGLEFKKEGFSFWNSTYHGISEFNGSSKATEVRSINLSPMSGFASLALFVTGDEGSAFEIQEAIKRYFYNNYSDHFAKLSHSLILDTLAANELTDVHLSVFCKMVGWCVGVFEGESKLNLFGSSINGSTATMLLQKNGNQYAPVLKITL